MEEVSVPAVLFLGDVAHHRQLRVHQVELLAALSGPVRFLFFITFDDPLRHIG